MKRIAFVVATPDTAVAFLSGHIDALSKYYDIDLIANFPNGYNSLLPLNKMLHVPIHRDINIWHDFVTLIKLARLFASNRYDAVHSVTPKAGLLAMTAAWIAQVPVRHHTFTGQVWVTKDGLFRWF
ncbi:glycosyltransferase [Marinobacter algicola]|uniref:glycosyltransferase n=1 Tax=Marinobacter algicola TaxID=236100 RepID=UPI0012F4B19F|nr:glycosyltransferase [Marinobacter algicola]